MGYSKYTAKYYSFAYQLPDENQLGMSQIVAGFLEDCLKIETFRTTWQLNLGSWENSQLKTVWTNWATWNKDIPN